MRLESRWSLGGGHVDPEALAQPGRPSGAVCWSLVCAHSASLSGEQEPAQSLRDAGRGSPRGQSSPCSVDSGGRSRPHDKHFTAPTASQPRGERRRPERARLCLTPGALPPQPWPRLVVHTTFTDSLERCLLAELQGESCSSGKSLNSSLGGPRAGPYSRKSGFPIKSTHFT